MNNKCIYYVEGPCEQQLIAALKEAPERLIPGEDKGLQCGAEFDSKITDVVYSGGNDCRFGI